MYAVEVQICLVAVEHHQQEFLDDCDGFVVLFGHVCSCDAEDSLALMGQPIFAVEDFVQNETARARLPRLAKAGNRQHPRSPQIAHAIVRTVHSSPALCICTLVT